LSEAYRDRLFREGNLNQSPAAVLQKLEIVREQVAHALYPDCMGGDRPLDKDIDLASRRRDVEKIQSFALGKADK